MQQPAPSLRSLDPTIPQALDDVVTRCVQPEPALRYQRTQELLIDLEAVTGGGAPDRRLARPGRTSARDAGAAAVRRRSRFRLPSLLSPGHRATGWPPVFVALVVGGRRVARCTARSPGPKAAAPSASASVPTARRCRWRSCRSEMPPGTIRLITWARRTGHARRGSRTIRGPDDDPSRTRISDSRGFADLRIWRSTRHSSPALRS